MLLPPISVRLIDYLVSNVDKQSTVGMELRTAKRKKLSAPGHKTPHNIPACGYFSGVFNGSFVYIKNSEEMTALYNTGCFGKGNLSRSEPSFNDLDDGVECILFEQTWMNRLRGGYESEKASTSKKKLKLTEDSINKFLLSPSVDAGHMWREWKSNEKTHKCANKNNEGTYLENSFLCSTSANEEMKPDTHLNQFVDEILASQRMRTQSVVDPVETIVLDENGCPRLENAPPPPKEVLQLTDCESFYLMFALGTLRIFDLEDQELNKDRIWHTFTEMDQRFVFRYAAYNWYRSRGWVVRSGLKYGGDFVLYEKEPKYCHSTYLLCVRHDTSRIQSWQEIIRYQRLVETFKKDIVFCHVSSVKTHSKEDLRTPKVISEFEVKEIMCRRWIPSQQRVK